MNRPIEESETTVDTSKAKRVSWMPVSQAEVDRDSRKSRARWRAVLGLGLLGLALIRLAFWGYSAFDPARWAYNGYYHPVVAIVRMDPEIVNRPIDGGWTLLYAASYGDQPEIVEFLIESGADPDLPMDGHNADSTNNAILALSNQTRSQIGLSPHRAPSPMRPVHVAAEEGNARAMKALAEGGAELNLPGGLFSEPPIIIAAKKGHIEIVRVLLEAGVDPNTRVLSPNQHGSPFVYTTLFYATTNGHVEVVKLLLDHGARVTYKRDDDLVTELIRFIVHAPEESDEKYQDWMRSMPKIVDLLVEALGDVNFRSDFGTTALHVALAGYDDHAGKLAIVRHLVENYPVLDVNAVDVLWETPLHKAVSARNVAGIKHLLENCPELNVNLTEKVSGYTPLKSAEKKLEYIPGMEFLEEDEKKDQQEQLREIIKLLKAHGGRVDKEAERRVREWIKRFNKDK